MPKKRMNDDLLSALIRMNFAKRYYDFCDASSGKATVECVMAKKDIDEAISAHDPGFKYFAKDKLYCYLETGEYGKIGLNISLLYGNLVELIIVLQVGEDDYTDLVTAIAEDVAKMENPNFSHDPPYPKMAFVDYNDLNNILDFSVSLFEDFKIAIDKIFT
jgi:hypothetical protein